jgi:MscS family membrane protein
MLEGATQSIITSILRSAFVFGLFWIIYNTLDPLLIVIHNLTTKFGKNLSKDISNFIIKALKFLVFTIGFVSILQEWGYNII